MLRCTLPLLFVTILVGRSYSQPGQIHIPRVQAMPNMPSPYIMRNWKDVAIKYDELVYSTSLVGQYLPLIHLGASGINFPTLQPILLDTYVGSSQAGAQAEAINIIPSLVGASLAGIDKSNQAGTNWVVKAKDFFNSANGQGVYLNGYSTSSGNDWWYDLMPNVFFYQLYSQYPSTPDFSSQATAVADRWLEAVNTMGGSTTPWTIAQMNYRAFALGSMTPNPNGVHEPEAAGAIAWLLYHAYLKTGHEEYLVGAQQSMEFLTGLASNPSYELQLSYGTLIAAKMNAELGTTYDMEKLLNWNFERGPLRGWGSVVGTWNGSDVSGLIGEANDAGNDYAFVLNGYQQAAALVPLVKYDKRFARAIGKWVLNLANASRLFYPKYLPISNQSDYAWSAAQDPESVIAYEALKENLSGIALFGTGDAKAAGWAATNLSLYSSSSVGYLAALIDTTNIPGILRLDLNKTDFFGAETFPSYLVYNPHPVTSQVTLSLGAQTYDIYDAVSQSIQATGATGDIAMDIPSDEAMLFVYLPPGSTPTVSNGKLYVGPEIIDYHFGYEFAGRPRIKSLAVADTLVEFNQVVPVYTAVDNSPGAVYNWYVNGVLSSSAPTAAFSWVAPTVAGSYVLRLELLVGPATVKDSLVMLVVDRIPVPPVVTGITADKSWYNATFTAILSCQATNEDGGLLQYAWSVPAGTILSQVGATINWRVPNEGLYEITCEVTNSDLLTTSSTKDILVKQVSPVQREPLAYFPFDGNTLDVSGNEHHATLQGAQPAPDSRGEPGKAYRFSTSSDLIYISNTSSFNFQNEITLSFWLSLDAVTQESFVLSHGSWEERWKVSVTPDRKLRWTVKNNTSTTDLDSSLPLTLNEFHHYTVVYSAYSMELYIDGQLDTFLANAGPMSSTTKAITFGKKDIAISNYFLRGTLDEVRIYDEALAPNEIETLKTQWTPDEVTSLVPEIQSFAIYPNPATGTIHVKDLNDPILNADLIDLTGKRLHSTWSISADGTGLIEYDNMVRGLLILRVETLHGVRYFKLLAE